MRPNCSTFYYLRFLWPLPNFTGLTPCASIVTLINLVILSIQYVRYVRIQNMIYIDINYYIREIHRGLQQSAGAVFEAKNYEGQVQGPGIQRVRFLSFIVLLWNRNITKQRIHFDLMRNYFLDICQNWRPGKFAHTLWDVTTHRSIRLLSCHLVWTDENGG